MWTSPYNQFFKNKFQVFTWKFAKIHFSNGIVIEREKNTALRVRKEVNSMELSSSRRKTIRHQFDSFCKKVLREKYRDCMREAQRRLQYEISFSDLSPQELDQLYVMDEYSTDSHHFSVMGYDVAVKDDLLSTALAALPETKRDIILLSYFLDMSDKEIGETLNMVRRTVQYYRTSSLKQLKELLEGKADDE
jgi:RNA polymerase sigma factor (sigma-70 family)